MPLARIITDVADNSVELALLLRSRGFQVETVPSSHVSAVKADLEVRMEECAVEDVSTRATEISAGEELCVFIAPGALDESTGPVLLEDRSRTFGRPDESARAESGLLAVPVRANETAPKPAPAETAEAPRPELTTTAWYATFAGSEVADVEEVMEGEAEVPQASPGTPVPATAVIAEEIETPAPTPQTELKPEISAAARSAEAEVSGAEATQVKPTVVKLEEAKAEGKAASEAAPVQTDRGPMPIAVKPPVPTELSDHERELPGFLPQVSTRTREETDRAFWRAAISAAVLATLIVFLGSIWHRSRPAPANLAPPASTQQVPFQPASNPEITGPRATSVRAQDSSPVKGTSTTASSPGPYDRPLTVDAAPSAAAPVQNLALRSPAPRRRAHSEDGGLIAKDTVVFYDRKSGSPSSSRAKPAAKTQPDAQ